MAGNFVSITNISMPASAVPGSYVTVNVVAQNVSGVPIIGVLHAVLNHDLLFIDTGDQMGVGESDTFAGSFAMPAQDSSVVFYTYYQDEYGNLISDDIQTQDINVSTTVPINGQILSYQILQGGRQMPSVKPGSKFDLEVFYYATKPDGGGWSVGLYLPDYNVAIVDSTTPQVGPVGGGTSLGNPNGSISKTFYGLVASSDETTTNINIDFLANPTYSQSSPPPGTGWISLDVVVASIITQWPTPEQDGYTQIQGPVIYPAGETYSGECSQATFIYTMSEVEAALFGDALLTKFATAFYQAAQQQNMEMLALNMYSRPTYELDSDGNSVYQNGYPITIPNSTDLLMVGSAYLPQPATRMGSPVMQSGISPAMWASIIQLVKILLIITAGYFAFQFIKNIFWGPATQTYHPAQDNPLPVSAGKTPITQDNATVTGPADVYDSTGTNKVNSIPAGSTQSVPKGDFTIATGTGAVIHYPAYTTTTYPQASSLTDTIKMIAIVGGVLVGGLVLISGFQSFGKRAVYPVKS